MVQLSRYQNCCSPGICIFHTEVLSRCQLYLQLELARDSLLSTMNSTLFYDLCVFLRTVEISTSLDLVAIAITPELLCYVAWLYSTKNALRGVLSGYN